MEGLSSIFLCILIPTAIGVDVKIRCKACSGVPKMEDCDHVMTCGHNEECYTKRTVGTLGNVLYESGCMSKETCSIIGSGKRSAERSRRDSVTCFQCCNADICNRHLCTSNPVVLNGTTECFSCNDVLRPEDCTYLRTCESDYQCKTSMYQSKTTFEIRYNLDCFRTDACNVLNTTNTTDNFCVRCCTNPYCNTQLCGFAEKVMPIFITKPQDRVVQPNDTIALQCRPLQIVGLPVIITWKHETAKHIITQPPVNYLEDRQVANMTITEDHYGTWTCILTNKNGQASAVAIVQPPVPNFG